MPRTQESRHAVEHTLRLKSSPTPEPHARDEEQLVLAGPVSAKHALEKLRRLPWPAAILDRSLQLTVDDTYRVGQLIVEQIHGGERNVQRSRKEWSLRRIQEQVLKSASFATLARCVQTYETCRALGLSPPLRDVRAGHLLNLSNLDRSRQRRLLERVGRKRLSVQALRETTGKVAGQGRRRTPGVVRALAALDKQDLLANVEQLAHLDRTESKRIATRVSEVQDQLRVIARQLKRQVRG